MNSGAISNPLFGTSGNFTQQYPAAGPGINVTLTAATPFPSGNPANEGSIFGEIRVKAAISTSVNLTLALWAA